MEDPAAAPIVAEAEAHIGELLALWLTPRPGECLPCFLHRSVEAFGCQNDLRFASRYRDLVAPRATRLRERLEACGGYCDCEALMNVFEPARHLWTPAYEEERPGGGAVCSDAEPPERMPPCGGVRRASTRPCGNWYALRRLYSGRLRRRRW
ncbi:DUF2695 domain-containing protein [Agrococcus carbonis]|uniref:DUF2695 domain-containing protein n=1 Tax=Agrococcus carbonis TaxID=684552 RepID=A0A1H1RN18_9MICO|nr:DUF2695 domain-containing protein [Agrococcus carbonis]SDS37098.1 Protein of unknown function [Agrococcus carbonis]